MFKNRETGKYGEEIAVTFLKQKGYHIISRNFKTRFAEIDIIALKDNRLIFVEVKTRFDHRFGLPQEAVTKRKLRHIERAAEQFMLSHPKLPQSPQIDVVAITLDPERNRHTTEHFKSVTS